MDNFSIEFGSAATPFSDAYLQEVEDALGTTFPESYANFLRSTNGGVPVAKYFDIGTNVKVVERFLSLVEHYKTDDFGIYDVEVVWSQIDDRLDDGVWPFAIAFAGDFLCFDGRSGDRQSVVLWDQDRSDIDSPHLIPIAPDFDSFLKMLHG
ncbi:MAG: SMI1/KNR4 family protein [Pseudomonadota bacterium]